MKYNVWLIYIIHACIYSYKNLSNKLFKRHYNKLQSKIVFGINVLFVNLVNVFKIHIKFHKRNLKVEFIKCLIL